MVPGNTFRKAERLSLNNRIKALFDTGIPVGIYPLRLIWMPASEPLEYPVQVMFTVSSRRFKRAVHRNYIKRRLKEIYRLQKPLFYEALEKHNMQLLLCIMFIGNNTAIPAEELRNKLVQGLETILRSTRPTL